MELSDLIPYIKQAFLANNVPITQPPASQYLEDPDGETADDELADLDGDKDTHDNIEGQILDSGFKELEVEKMLEQEEKQKARQGTYVAGFNNLFAKQASNKVTYWDKLVERYERNHRWKNPFKT